LKVAHICPRIGYRGGTETFVREVNESMNGLGVESSIYSTDLVPSPTLLSLMGVSTLLGRKALRDGFDALVFHKGQGASLFFRRSRAICYFHQVKYDDLVDGTFVRAAYRDSLAAIERHLVRVVCNSAYVASRLRGLMPKANVAIVPPGTKNFLRDPEKTHEEGFCYYHSRIHPRKNQDFLLTVFEGLPFDLYLTGGTWDRPFREYHRMILQRAAEMSNVRFLRDVSENTHFDLLSRCSLFVFPAKKEPFGMVLLDAMCFGKPIIALNSGASPEVLDGAGILCNDNVDDWRASITDLLSNPGTRSSLSRRSLARVNGFTWDRTAKELIQILENA